MRATLNGWLLALCALTLGALCGGARADFAVPAPFERPDAISNEGGLWALMDREESRLRHSPFVLRDQALNDYVRGIVCRLAGDRCSEIRVYLVRTPYFNASMAPNGTLQIWTGLLLRAANEAQLAAVIGHEIGHFKRHHTVERLADARSTSAMAQFVDIALGAIGIGKLGRITQLGGLASHFAFSRDNESEADTIGLELMHAAGYDPMEAARVWEQLIEEGEDDYGGGLALFATHPTPSSRHERLAMQARRLRADAAGGEIHAQRYHEAIAALRPQMVQDELCRRVPDSSLRLFERLIRYQGEDGLLLYARAAALSARDGDGDAERALAVLDASSGRADRPAEADRLRAHLLRRKGDTGPAREAFTRYLERAPDAPDAPMIRHYVNTL